MTGRLRFRDLDTDIDQRLTLNGIPFTGVAFETYSNGQLREEQSFVDGIPEGFGRSWYANGQLADEGSSHRGAPHGIVRQYYDSGALKQEALCEFGICIKRKQWDKCGNIVEIYEIEGDGWQMRLLKQYRNQEDRADA